MNKESCRETNVDPDIFLMEFVRILLSGKLQGIEPNYANELVPDKFPDKFPDIFLINFLIFS